MNKIKSFGNIFPFLTTLEYIQLNIYEIRWYQSKGWPTISWWKMLKAIPTPKFQTDSRTTWYLMYLMKSILMMISTEAKQELSCIKQKTKKLSIYIVIYLLLNLLLYYVWLKKNIVAYKSIKIRMIIPVGERTMVNELVSPPFTPLPYHE